MEVRGIKIQLRAPYFVDHLSPHGFLTMDPACQACWYYYIIANNANSAVGRGPIDQIIEINEESKTDVPLWMDKRFNAQAKSVALLYGLDSPEDMMKFWPNVKLEIHRLGLSPPTDEMIHLTGHDRIT